MSAGEDFTCAIDQDGILGCWNNKEMLDNPEKDAQVYHPLETLKQIDEGIHVPTKYIEVSVHKQIICALDDLINLKCWSNAKSTLGDPFKQVLDIPQLLNTEIENVSVGLSNVCVIDKYRQLYCWRQYSNEQDKVGNLEYLFMTKQIISYNRELVSNLVQLEVGDEYVSVLDESGNQYISKGHLEHGDLNQVTSGINKISTGKEYACAINSNFQLMCYKWNDKRKVHERIKVPKKMNMTKNIELDMDDCVCVTTSDFKIRCWDFQYEVKQIVSPKGFDNLTVGSNHVCGLNFENQNVQCYKLELRIEKPVVPLEVQTSSVKIQVGQSTTCAVDDKGKLRLWLNKPFQNDKQLIEEDGFSNKFSMKDNQLCAVIDSDDEIFSNKLLCWYIKKDKIAFLSLPDEIDRVLNVYTGSDRIQALTPDNLLHCWQQSDHDEDEVEQPYIPPWQNKSRDRSKQIAEIENEVNISVNHKEETGGEDQIVSDTRKKEAMLHAKIQSCYIPDVFKHPKSMITMSAGKDWACGINIDNILFCWGIDRSDDDDEDDDESQHSQSDQEMHQENDIQNSDIHAKHEQSDGEEVDSHMPPNLRTVNSDQSQIEQISSNKSNDSTFTQSNPELDKSSESIKSQVLLEIVVIDEDVWQIDVGPDIFCWIMQTSNQLKCRKIRCIFDDLAVPSEFEEGTKQVSVGKNQVCAIDSLHTLKCFHEFEENYQFTLIRNHTVQKVEAGINHQCVILMDGTLRCGINEYKDKDITKKDLVEDKNIVKEENILI